MSGPLENGGKERPTGAADDGAVPTSPDGSWGRVAPAAGYICGVSLLLATLLFLGDATGWLAEPVGYRTTSAGPESDLATWYAAHFERQHEILWSVVVRDVLFPLSFLALMVLALATSSLVGWHLPSAQLAALLFVVGGLLHIVNDLVFLGQVEYWRYDGWRADPAGPMVAVGQAAGAIGAAVTYVELASYLVLGAALLCWGSLYRTRPELPGWLGGLVYAEAAGMVVLVLGQLLGSDLLFQLGGATTGIVVGPLVAVLLGRHIGRVAAPRTTAARR